MVSAKNTDRVEESIHKNIIYSIARNAMVFVNFFMYKRSHLIQIAI